ncbi:Penicillin binding protein transpeptidase domain-containing protein [Trichlorobacter thiogenes]|uniref:Penicillin binding protein transpeptidase domain-containing protein n=1 Tax=Trichlorobacter thiogenes TaxID=115783 RepID=A0A1T4NSQ3_9BACT|nr:penicillin-binding transpeptidase domain-containing protein [Trichlorobacter thiogenes]SJZ82281.1 Penicillin binding protein transpeptidase domain-containing protein [Trichlorobacter thiogenes]
MQDFKHLTRRKKNFFQRHWQSAALGTAVALLFIPLTVMLVRKAAQAVSVWQDTRSQIELKAQPISLGDDLFAIASGLLPAAVSSGETLTATAPDGTSLKLSINPALQQRVQGYLEQTRPPYAIFVAVEPATGRVLSLAGYSTVDQNWQQNAAYQVYPMASLFKMVTAASALENNKINPTTVLEFRGRLVSETPKNWDPSPKGRNNKMDVTEAMGKSVNPIYGRIASDLLGKERLKQTCNNFGFNRPLLLPGVPAVPSPAPAVETSNDLRLQGCGLDHGLQVSPIHAAAITAAIANRGRMMAPRLVDQATRNGKELKVPATRELAKVISPEAADNLTRMLLTTVTSGTSRKAFHSPEGRRLTSDMKIAAKTGSIDGDNPKGHYSWFAAYAPADQPRIALVALVINGDKWKIKASQLGEQALAEFFRQGK